MTRNILSKSMKSDGLNMPLLRSWNLLGADFYKDVTPTAFSMHRVTATSKTVRLSHIR
jgi:hypothetical protein